MINHVKYFLRWILVALMIIMTIDVLWGVVTRYFMGAQASWTEELARFLLIWIGILGAAYASGNSSHLAIDLWEPFLKGNRKNYHALILDFLVGVFAFLVLVIGGSRLIYLTNSLGQYSAALKVPMSLVYSIIPISGLLIIYFKGRSIKMVLNRMNLLK